MQRTKKVNTAKHQKSKDKDRVTFNAISSVITRTYLILQ